MDIKELIMSRHSVRSYKADPLSPEVLSDILEAGRLAPSAQNRQPWRFIVIQGTDKIKSLSVNCGLLGLSNFFIRQAPCVIIACADTRRSIRINDQDYYLVDTAIAFQQMMLMALAHGIGSCWIAAFSEKKLRKWLKIDDKWKIVALSPFGYPAEKDTLHARMVSGFARSSNRLPLEQIVHYF
ncbi:MAG: nitroreductase family protein [Candidatus Cloacimonetes bacterium]|nr:nitroreductase family protein [Candidatus Cloacimonadota bacterium]